MKEYLRRKKFSAEEISDAVSFLKEHGFLNDRSFAEAFIDSRIGRLDGPQKIKQMLFQKGIDLKEADSLLREKYPQELQIENARSLLRRRKGDRNKLLRFVASRGFPQYVIIQAFKELSSSH